MVMGGYGVVRDCYGVVFGWYGWLLSSYRLFLVVKVVVVDFEVSAVKELFKKV